jgi:hypothetical protein
MRGEAGIFTAVKRTLLAAALLVTSVFGVTGCGSDDDVAVESRVKNVAPEAPEASAVSDAPSESDCDLLDRLDLYDFLDLLYDRLYRLGLLDDLLDGEFRDFLDLLDRLEVLDDLLDQCAAASKSGADAPKGDDVERKEP